MTKISELSSIGDSLAIGDQFLIRDIDDTGSPNKSVTVSGITRALDVGTALAPAIAFASDKNTGIYSPGADTLAFVEGGTEVIRIDSSGRVGIGTGSPEQQLTIVNTTSVAAGSTLSVVGGTSNNAGEGGSIAFSNFVKSGVTSAARIRSGLVNAITQETGNLVFETNGGAGLTEKMRIDFSGNVGIGTASPGARLEIVTPTDGDGIRLGQLNTPVGQNGPAITFAQMNNAGTLINTSSIKGALVGGSVGAEAGELVFNTVIGGAAPAERMRIDSAGEVGIGTSAPVEKLHVAGNIALDNEVLNTPRYIHFRSNAVATEYGGIKWYNFQWNNTIRASITSGPDGAVANGYLAFSTGNSGLDATEKMRIDSIGKVGIGTASPTSLGTNVTTLEIQGAVTTRSGGIRLSSSDSSQKGAFYIYDGVAVLGTETSHPLGLYVGNTERARIDTSGRLLVGTGSDSGGALFQVNGDRIRVGTAKTPATSGATGTTGEIAWDADYIYVCTATNTWKRSAIATW